MAALSFNFPAAFLHRSSTLVLLLIVVGSAGPAALALQLPTSATASAFSSAAADDYQQNSQGFLSSISYWANDPRKKVEYFINDGPWQNARKFAGPNPSSGDPQEKPRTFTGSIWSSDGGQQRSSVTDECSVVAFGARGNGVEFDTSAIQAAIDACAFRNGVVYFPPGEYLTATVFLKSNTTVRIDPEATILGSPYQKDYPTERRRWYVILAEDAENVEVTGGGKVDGQGLKFVSRFDERKNVMVSWNTTGDCFGDECRPRLIGFLNCTNVHVWNLVLHEPAYWCLNLVNSDNILIQNVRIYGDFNSPNNDGIDIDSSNNTKITGCHIDTGDDAISPKTGTGPLFNLTVSDCWIRTKSSGVKLGSASWFGIQGLRFERLKIVDSHRGLGIQLRDPGNISDVTFANIDMSTRYYDSSWWGRAEPIYVTACPRDTSTVVGSITDVHFVNISSRSQNGIFLAGSEESLLSNISFQNVSMSYSNSNGIAGPAYHDYRPGCQGLVAHPTSGLFIEYASGLSFLDASFTWDPNVSWSVPFDFTPMTVGSLTLLNFTTSPKYICGPRG